MALPCSLRAVFTFYHALCLQRPRPPNMWIHHDFKCHINEREKPKTCLTNHKGSISHPITPLAINECHYATRSPIAKLIFKVMCTHTVNLAVNSKSSSKRWDVPAFCESSQKLFVLLYVWIEDWLWRSVSIIQVLTFWVQRGRRIRQNTCALVASSALHW